MEKFSQIRHIIRKVDAPNLPRARGANFEPVKVRPLWKKVGC